SEEGDQQISFTQRVSTKNECFRLLGHGLTRIHGLPESPKLPKIKRKIPPPYSRAEENARSLNGRRDDVIFSDFVRRQEIPIPGHFSLRRKNAQQ
ncbi:MAG TPA: hypothetical protein VFR08_10355, partial [Candidatus Angelobacter sp.]|nr:hypothetical protein [Candidatus Angelobacter sp.]